jgi:hypothetical protein
MSVNAEIPTGLEAVIRRNVGSDLNAYAREALAVQMYRDRMLTHGQLQRFLGVQSYEADTILKKNTGAWTKSPPRNWRPRCKFPTMPAKGTDWDDRCL